MAYTNSSCNPVIYTIFNKDFRSAFYKLILRRRRRPRGSNSDKPGSLQLSTFENTSNGNGIAASAAIFGQTAV